MPEEASPFRCESRLVLRAQSGDLAAWDRLLLATQGWLHAYLTRLVKDRHVADELLQEVFLLIFRKLRFLHEPRAYRAWVYRIATRQAFRHIKREKDRPEVADGGRFDALPTNGGCTGLEPQELARIDEAITFLTPNTRAVIVLHYFEGLSIRQVADVLDIALGTAKSRLADGLARLRTRMPAEGASCRDD